MKIIHFRFMVAILLSWDQQTYISSGEKHKRKEEKMKLTPPKTITWWIAVALGVLALLGQTHTIPALSPYSFWLAIVGLALLIVACLVKKL